MSAIRSQKQSPADAAPAPPRRVKVRVRRKRPTQAVTPIDITRVDTDILPTIRVVAPGETGPLIAPNSPLSLVAVDGAHIHDLREVSDAQPMPDAEPDQATDAPVAPPEESGVPDASEMGDPSAESAESAESDEGLVFSAALLAPTIEMAEASTPTAPDLTTEPTTRLTAEPEAEVEPEAAPERSAPVRRMPTLAVMAALTQRSEPAASSPATEGDATGSADSDEQVTGVLRPRAARPTAPLRDTDHLDTAALDTPEATAAASAAPDAQTGSVAEPPMEESDATQTSDAPEAPQLGASAEPGGHWMWWRQAAQRRAAPQTRPIAAVSGAIPDEELDITAPRPASRRSTKSLVSAGQQATRSETPRATEAPDDSGATDTDEALAQRARPLYARRRAGAPRSPRATALSWVAGGHAAVASVAALIAVIAALRNSAGPDAWAVFGWALALALIAGGGAAIGYTLAQVRRPHLATFALTLSEAGMLVWALGLLGPRAALLALAPASAALALRGAGRVSAVATAFIWMLLFVVDEALTLTGALTPVLPLDGAAAALVDVALPLVGLWLAVSILISLYSSRMRVVAHGRAVEHAALLTEAQLNRLRTQTEDDAEALRRALAEALRGEQPERIYAHGALSVVADTVNEIADRLVDLRYDRAERKRLESAARRLTRVIERAWLGLSWSWPDATGTILDDLLALLRTPPPDASDLLDETTATGQVVAPHLFRGWRPTEPTPRAQRGPSTPPGTRSEPSQPSQPSLPSLWPSDPGVGLSDKLELPPSPRWRSPDALFGASDRPKPTER